MKKLIAKISIPFLCLALSSSLYANEKVYKFTMATTWGETVSPLFDTAQNMADMANKMSNGRIEIKIDSANKHKAPLGILDMVKGGQYDMGHSASYYWKGKDIDTLPFTTMPFGMTTPEQYAWFYYGGGMELMKKAYAKQGV